MRERRVIILTSIINLLVASIKLILGLLFSFSTLVADSIQSFIDYFTDITSLIANKIGKRRANKTYPFGYGQVYYLSNLLTGLLLFLIGVFIVYQVFTSKSVFEPNLHILLFLLLVLLLKLIVILLLKIHGKTTKNELLLESYKESLTDFISTCIVIIVLILSYFEKYIPEFINIDKIGSFLMALYVFYTSIKMIVSNIGGILVNDKENIDIKEDIIKELESFKQIEIINMRIIKMSNYYSVFLKIDVDNNLKIKDFLRLERRIIKKLKDSNRLIRFIDIEPQ